MKAHIRFFIPILAGAVLLASCSSDFRPPNMPRGTLPVGTGTPAATNAKAGTPAAIDTTIPTLVTAGPGTGQNNTAVPAIPTNTPSAATSGGNTGGTVSTPVPGATAGSPGIPNTGGNGSALPSSIAVPAQVQTIQFPTGTSSYVVNTNLQSGTTQAYRLAAQNGQRMYITIDGDAAMQVYDPNQNAMTGVLTAVNPLQVSLTRAGNFTIALAGQGPVTMSVYVPPTNGNQNVAAPIPAQVRSVEFAAGGTATSLTPTLTNGTPFGYTINAKSGQTLGVTTGGNATVTLLAPDQLTMVPSAPAPTHQWLFPLSQSGSYTLVVYGDGPVRLDLSIPAIPTTGGQTGGTTGGTNGGHTGGPAIPIPANPQRITIPTGNASSTVNANLASGTPQAYLLNIQSGQTLYVSTTGVVDVTIYGPGSTVLASGHSNYPDLWSTQASQTGDYTFVISGNGPSTLTFYIPPQ